VHPLAALHGARLPRAWRMRIDQIMSPDDLIFRKNCAALEACDPALFARLCLPVSSDHVRTSDGAVEYRSHRYWYRVEPSEHEVRDVCRGAAGAREILLLGVGEGSLCAAMLDQCPDARITAWERDPWLMRLCLKRHDVSAALQLGKLRFSLGADLVDEVEEAGKKHIVRHPFFGAIYRRECRLVSEPSDRPMALIRDGALFVDDMTGALYEAGYRVYTIDMGILSREEMHHCVAKCRAKLLASINYKHLLAEFCFEEALKLVCWEIDPSLEFPQSPKTSTNRAFVFSYRRANVKRYVEAGFAHAEYLALAADTQKRSPAALDAAEKQIYASPVSYVGASLVTEAAQNHAEFVRLYAEWAGGANAAQWAEEKLDVIEERQSENLSDYIFPRLLRQQFSGFLDAMARDKPYINLEVMAAQGVASLKRRSTVEALAPFGMLVWGDSGWRSVEKSGARYAGRYAAHDGELNKVYCASMINVDIGRIYQPDIVTMRVFDVLACGGFVIAEHSGDLETLFRVGVEVESYGSLDELCEKVSHYLAHSEEARRIAEQGRSAVKERHSMKHRFGTIFERAGMLPPPR